MHQSFIRHFSCPDIHFFIVYFLTIFKKNHNRSSSDIHTKTQKKANMFLLLFMYSGGVDVFNPITYKSIWGKCIVIIVIVFLCSWYSVRVATNDCFHNRFFWQLFSQINQLLIGLWCEERFSSLFAKPKLIQR